MLKNRIYHFNGFEFYINSNQNKEYKGRYKILVYLDRYISIGTANTISEAKEIMKAWRY